MDSQIIVGSVHIIESPRGEDRRTELESHTALAAIGFDGMIDCRISCADYYDRLRDLAKSGDERKT